MKAPFSTMQAKNKIAENYRQKLDELPFSYELMQIETTYGDTNIIITGSANKPALVLPAGTDSVISFTMAITIELANDFRIYWIDFPPRSNQGTEFQLKFEDDSYGEWMFEILSRLNVHNAVLAGIEFGGFIALKTLIFDEKRIARVFLITPAGIIKPQRIRYLFKKLLQLHQLKKHRKKYRKTAIFQIPVLSESKISKMKTPVYFFAAENDLFFSAKRLRKRANKIFTSLKGNHILNEAPPPPYHHLFKTIRENNHANSTN
ncbi:alpha/beta hydrolase [Draconibacterium orientale]|uniref:alpha/beta fold hydrolase n=1 Tax=Draconibacterium orientale TaxID=1168034 RepID=UPI0029C0FEF8|nr:alpha/beta hydrolase [Draconibacterium orientale]